VVGDDSCPVNNVLEVQENGGNNVLHQAQLWTMKVYSSVLIMSVVQSFHFLYIFIFVGSSK
jgi:hypothetical protein